MMLKKYVKENFIFYTQATQKNGGEKKWIAFKEKCYVIDEFVTFCTGFLKTHETTLLSLN
jgi:hypothetical protein